jgi:hypothetical protein
MIRIVPYARRFYARLQPLGRKLQSNSLNAALRGPQ